MKFSKSTFVSSFGFLAQMDFRLANVTIDLELFMILLFGLLFGDLSHAFSLHAKAWDKSF